jgi:hypothetical protein
MRHLPAGKKLSKKPRWETPSELRVLKEKQKTFHANSQSSLRKEDLSYAATSRTFMSTMGDVTMGPR